jgi:hypothetical protein
VGPDLILLTDPMQDQSLVIMVVDPDPALFLKLDPDPHLNLNLEDLGAVKCSRGRSQWRRGGSKWSPGGSVNQC